MGTLRFAHPTETSSLPSFRRRPEFSVDGHAALCPSYRDLVFAVIPAQAGIQLSF
jgi:hypothetical protein